MIERIDPKRLPPATALRQEIEKHRRSVMVAASGMGPVLDMLDAYIVTTEARIEKLELLAALREKLRS